MPEGVEPSYPEIDPVYNVYWGWGIVDAYEAIRVAEQEDIRPPIISDVNTAVSGNTATITWHTHKSANSRIEYGLSDTNLDWVVEDLYTYQFDHTMLLDDLDYDTDYYFMIKGWDEDGNGPGESTIGTFHTEILPDTTPPIISNVNSHATDTTATIMWDTDELADSVVEYGETEVLGSIEINSTLEYDHSVTLTNLQPSTTYYFRVNSTDTSGNYANGKVMQFTTEEGPDITPPKITDVMVEDITESSATVTWKTNEPSDSLVKYGETTTYVAEVSDPTLAFDHSLKITGLDHSEEYHYLIQSKDMAGNLQDYEGTFNTASPPDETPPNIVGDIEVTTTDKTATILWTTDEESDSLVRYGITESYGLEEPADGPTDEYVIVHNITLTDLSHSTTYHFQVESRDTSPNKNPATSGDYTFTTKPKADITKPKIIAGPTVLVVGEDTATIVWTTDEDSDTVLHYGTDDSYGQTVSDPTRVIGHEVTLTGLIPSTTYHFKVRSTDAAGNWQESQDREFTTLDIIIPIDIEFLNIANGEIIKGVKTVEARITGGEGLIIHGVRYKIDDGAWENLGSGSAFSITIDSAALDEGEHTLYVEVTIGKLSQEVTMQEDVVFVVEHEKVDNSVFFMGIGFALAIIIILGAAIFVRNSAVKRRKERAEATAMEPFGGSPFTPKDFSSDTDIGIGFIPEEEPVGVADMVEDISFSPDDEIFETELGLSFVPDTPILMEDPDIAFVPDMAPVSFSAFEEEPEPIFSEMDKVRCPKCKRTFETDLSSDVDCPHCGFSSGVKTW
jgi:chitodextrinase